jgi:hypothetical protein
MSYEYDGPILSATYMEALCKDEFLLQEWPPKQPETKPSLSGISP